MIPLWIHIIHIAWKDHLNCIEISHFPIHNTANMTELTRR
jgi:hypothetical protein